MEDSGAGLGATGSGASGVAGGISRPGRLRSAVFLLTVVGFVLPPAAYFWFIHRYAVNMIWQDQWNDVILVSLSYSHHLNFGAIWAQHVENRLLFPNLIVLILPMSTNLNIVFEEYLSALMMVVATALFILAHRRRSPSTPWIYYCPVAFVMLSFAQAGNMLWGFQLAWYLVMISLAVTVFLVDRPTLAWLGMTGAIVVALVGSFSSLQGLLIWPAGLVLLYCRRRSNAFVLTWITAAVVAGLLYISDLNYRAATRFGGNPSYVVHHPIATINFFLSTVGVRHALLGVIILAIAVWVIITRGIHRGSGDGSAVGVAMVCFGLLFASTITVGRASYGAGDWTEAVRDATFDLLILAGCYLALLDRPSESNTHAWDQTLLGSIRAILVVTICLVVFFGFTNGIDYAGKWHQTEALARDVTVNIKCASNSLVVSALAPGNPSSFATDVRQWARIARTHDLALLGGQHTVDKRPPMTKVLRPLNGSTLQGNELLDAAAVDSDNVCSVAKVEFRVTGGPLTYALIANGKQRSEERRV